jgi:hypothetical protein
MALGSLVGRAFIRIDADTSPAKKAITALGAIGSQGGILALSGTIAPVTAGVMALASSFAVAGGAATAFGAAVIPQFQDISKAMKQQQVAEDAKTKSAVQSSLAQDMAAKFGYKYGQAVKITANMSAEAKEQAQQYNTALSASKTATKTATTQQALYKQELNGMPPATRATTEALLKLKSSSQEWSRSLADSTMPMFTRGIEGLTNLLPKLTPIVKDVASQVDFFMSTLGAGTAGRVFREFGHNIQKNGAGALTTFLNVMKNLTVGFVGLLNAFMPMSKGVSGGLEDMTEKFAEWSAGLSKSDKFADFIARMKETGPGLAQTFGQIVQTVVTLVQAMGPLAGTSLRVAQVFAAIIAAIPTPVLKLLAQAIVITNVALKLYAIYQSAAAAATWLFSTSVTTNTGVVYANRLALIASTIAMGIFRAALIAQRIAMIATTVAARALAVAMLLVTSPIGLVVLAIVALVAVFIIAWKKSETFRNIVKGALNAIKDAALAVARWFAGPFVNFFVQAWGAVKRNAIDPMVRFFTKTIPDAARATRDAVVGAFRRVRDFMNEAWGTIKRGAVDPIVKFFTKTLPGAARGARDVVVGAIRWLALKVLDAFGSIIKGAAKIFGWVPGVGGKLKSAVKSFNKFRDDVNRALGGIKDRTQSTFVTFKGKSIAAVSAGRLAAGGPVRGPGSGTSDDVPIWASNDEHMWTAQEVRAVGGHKAMMRLREMARLGAFQGYASGGAVTARGRFPSNKTINSQLSSGYHRFVMSSSSALYATMQKMLSMLSAGPSFVGLGGTVGAGAAAAMRYAQALLNAHIYGWGPGQWPAWRSLGMGESGWRWNALNASSGAYGIPQALPAGKMASAGSDWRTNPATQIRWMASYIKGRYGTPAGAWGAWLSRSPHWYDGGGIARGAGLIPKMTNAPERVLSPKQTELFERMITGRGRAGNPDAVTIIIERLVLENKGVIGSRHEVENWLVSAFDQLQRKGRIKAVSA